jgi:hypothetical protein
MVLFEVVTVPELDDAVSQLGTLAGLTCSAGGLTMSVAVRVWVPCPVSVSAKVMVALYVAAARVFAFA